MKIEIGAVSAAEVDAIAALARVVWQDTYSGIISQEQIDFMLEQRYNATRLREELASSGVCWDRIRVDGELAGFASSVLLPGLAEMKLDKLYVDPARQRLGLGGRLIAQVVERALANACDVLILAVNKRNERAIAAYRKHGFAMRDAVWVDIGNGFAMDDFIMAKPLIPSGVTASAKTSEGNTAG